MPWLKCPHCENGKLQEVVDSRVRAANTVARIRKCDNCGKRQLTHEVTYDMKYITIRIEDKVGNFYLKCHTLQEALSHVASHNGEWKSYTILDSRKWKGRTLSKGRCSLGK